MRTQRDYAEAFEIWGLMQHTQHAILRVRYNELKAVGISPMESGVLWVIKHMDQPATPSEISRRVFRKPHTVFTLLNAMQRRGLVEKIKDMKRKNMVRIVLTQKGEESCRMAIDIREKVPEIILSLPEEDRVKLRTSLLTLRQKAFEELREGTDLLGFVLDRDRLLPS